MNFALERARGNIPPAFASPLELRGAGATVVPARKRQPVQARRRATIKPAPKCQNAAGYSCHWQQFKASASQVGNQHFTRKRWFLLASNSDWAPYIGIGYARLLADHVSTFQTQAHDTAVHRRIGALESHVSQLISHLSDVRMKAR